MFLGVWTRVCVSNGACSGERREAAVLYDTLQGLDALLHGRHNHGNILPRLISLDEDISHSKELIMARDVICGILPGPSILTFETVVRKFFVPLLATRAMGRFVGIELNDILRRLTVSSSRTTGPGAAVRAGCVW